MGAIILWPRLEGPAKFFLPAFRFHRHLHPASIFYVMLQLMHAYAI